MDDDRSEIAQLARDANLVVAYAARVGKLPDATLAMSTVAVQAALAGSGPSPDLYASFLQQLNNSVRAIAPVSVLDLGSTWRPFPKAPNSPWPNRVVVLIAVLLIATAAFYTQLFTTASETLASLNLFTNASADEKLDRLAAIVRKHPELAPRYGNVPGPGRDNPPSANDSALQAAIGDSAAVLSDLLKELRTINRQKSDVDAEMFDISQFDALYPPWVTSPYRAAIWLTEQVRPARANASPLPSQQDYLNGLTDNSPPKAGNVPSASSIGACNLDPATSDPACTFSLTALVDLPAQVQLESGSREYCKRIVFIFGNWILPALYGLIGATVFQMRRILDPMQPSLPPVRLCFRIALGMFAGIIVTWFWSPSVDRIAIGESISITAFGAAFLVGYSSEIFFALLDSGVDQMLHAIRGKLKTAA